MTSTAFHGPRSRENARLLLDAASALGYPSTVVKTTKGGYNAPQDVVDMALGVADIEEGKTYPAPDAGSDGVPVLTTEVTKENAADAAKAEEIKTSLVRPNNGASREEWKNYAESVGVEVTENDKRDGIIEKVDAKEGSN